MLTCGRYLFGQRSRRKSVGVLASERLLLARAKRSLLNRARMLVHGRSSAPSEDPRHPANRDKEKGAGGSVTPDSAPAAPSHRRVQSVGSPTVPPSQAMVCLHEFVAQTRRALRSRACDAGCGKAIRAGIATTVHKCVKCGAKVHAGCLPRMQALVLASLAAPDATSPRRGDDTRTGSPGGAADDSSPSTAPESPHAAADTGAVTTRGRSASGPAELSGAASGPPQEEAGFAALAGAAAESASAVADAVAGVAGRAAAALGLDIGDQPSLDDFNGTSSSSSSSDDSASDDEGGVARPVKLNRKQRRAARRVASLAGVMYFRHVRVGEVTLSLSTQGFKWNLAAAQVKIPETTLYRKLWTWRTLFRRLRKRVVWQVTKSAPMLVKHSMRKGRRLERAVKPLAPLAAFSRTYYLRLDPEMRMEFEYVVCVCVCVCVCACVAVWLCGRVACVIVG